MILKQLKHTFKFLPLVAAIAITLAFSTSKASFENSTAVGADSKEFKLSLLNAFNYSFTTNAADNNDEEVYYQGISYNGTLFFLDKYYGNFGVGANYHTVGSTLQENDNGIFHLSDFRLGVGNTGWNLYRSKKDSISLFANISNTLPLSEQSRNEGYKSVPSVGLDLAYRRGGLGLVLSGRQTYVWNSFETNTLGLYNTEWASSGRITARYDWKRFRFQYSYRLSVRTFMDGSSLGGSGNALCCSISYHAGYGHTS